MMVRFDVLLYIYLIVCIIYHVSTSYMIDPLSENITGEVQYGFKGKAKRATKPKQSSKRKQAPIVVESSTDEEESTEEGDEEESEESSLNIRTSHPFVPASQKRVPVPINILDPSPPPPKPKKQKVGEEPEDYNLPKKILGGVDAITSFIQFCEKNITDVDEFHHTGFRTPDFRLEALLVVDSRSQLEILAECKKILDLKESVELQSRKLAYCFGRNISTLKNCTPKTSEEIAYTWASLSHEFKKAPATLKRYTAFYELCKKYPRFLRVNTTYTILALNSTQILNKLDKDYPLANVWKNFDDVDDKPVEPVRERKDSNLPPITNVTAYARSPDTESQTSEHTQHTDKTESSHAPSTQQSDGSLEGLENRFNDI